MALAHAIFHLILTVLLGADICLPLLVEKTDIQKGEVSCSRSHSQEVVEQGNEARFF